MLNGVHVHSYLADTVWQTPLLPHIIEACPRYGTVCTGKRADAACSHSVDNQCADARITRNAVEGVELR